MEENSRGYGSELFDIDMGGLESLDFMGRTQSDKLLSKIDIAS